MSSSRLDVQVANIAALLMALDAAELRTVADEHATAAGNIADGDPAKSFVAAGAAVFSILADARERIADVPPPSVPTSALSPATPHPHARGRSL